MGALAAKILFKTGNDKFEINKYQSLNQVEVTTINGHKSKIGDFVQDSKLYIIVNVASKWMVAKKNYEQLVQIHNQYKDQGVQILAFPCN